MTDLADRNHVEGCLEGSRDLGGGLDAASREPDDDDVGSTLGFQR